jgi:acyl carrier protein
MHNQETPVETQVRKIIAASLARDLSEVQLKSALMGELGAESLDFLDIVFKLEQTFKIQITRGEMERAARGDMSAEEFAPEGVISEAGLSRLRELMPEASEQIQPGLRPAQIIGLFSVRTFVAIINGKIAQQAA